jgi:hypothetical protein
MRWDAAVFSGAKCGVIIFIFFLGMKSEDRGFFRFGNIQIPVVLTGVTAFRFQVR